MSNKQNDHYNETVELENVSFGFDNKGRYEYKDGKKVYTPISKAEQGKQWEETFDEEVNKLRRVVLLYEGDSKTYPFGFKSRIQDLTFTVTDWGNIKEFIKETIATQVAAAEARQRAIIKEWAKKYQDQARDDPWAFGRNTEMCRGIVQATNDLVKLLDSNPQ